MNNYQDLDLHKYYLDDRIEAILKDVDYWYAFKQNSMEGIQAHQQLYLDINALYKKRLMFSQEFPKLSDYNYRFYLSGSSSKVSAIYLPFKHS